MIDGIERRLQPVNALTTGKNANDILLSAMRWQSFRKNRKGLPMKKRIDLFLESQNFQWLMGEMAARELKAGSVVDRLIENARAEVPAQSPNPAPNALDLAPEASDLSQFLPERQKAT